MEVFNHMLDRQELYYLENDVLLEKVYSSDVPIIKYINDSFEFCGKSEGDCCLYKIPENTDITNIYGDYTYDDISFHIEKLTIKSISIFGNPHKVWMITNKDNKLLDIYFYNQFGKSSLALYPFAYKLALGKELNEKDLAMGYEDQIFFHFDKSEII